MSSRWIWAVPVVMVFGALPAVLSAQVELEYQNRGRYHEGVKARPIASSEIELVSVLVDHREPVGPLPDEIKVKFFLQDEVDVHLVVRELDYKHYYWLDRVQPPRPKPWSPGFHNVFQWSTDTVLRRLDRNMSVFDLGVLVRLKQKDPSLQEHIAPAILFYSRSPRSIGAYLFTLRTNGDARLSCSVYGEGAESPLWTQFITRNPGGRPFSVRWDASEAREGTYKLVVEGYLRDTGQALRQVVSFYHRPTAN